MHVDLKFWRTQICVNKLSLFYAFDKWKAILNFQSDEMMKMKTRSFFLQGCLGERWQALILLSLRISFQTKTNKPLIEAENVKMWLTCLYKCLHVTPSD